MRYLITFSYDGTKFHGFQRQNNAFNVQGFLEHTLSNYFDTNILIKGSGRTDAGVHANGQCAHFDVDKKITNNDIKKINKLLQNKIIIKKIRMVGDNFHARRDVKMKHYSYKINNGVFEERLKGYYYQIGYNLNMKVMKSVCKLLEGTHNFHNFVSGERIDYVSTIYKIKIREWKNIIVIDFWSIGFYRYMVRHLVGAIIDVGKGNAQIKDIQDMLDKPDVFKNLSVVPADGLYLEKVFY